MVWSHILDKANYPVVNITWDKAVNSLYIIDTQISNDLTSFQVFVGLKYWNYIGNKQILYKWALSGINYNQIAIIDGGIGTINNNYKLELTSSRNLIGNISPGLFIYHNGVPFSTFDKDNDLSTINCSDQYNRTPFWYSTCWSGSINGGGGVSYTNGAYWNGSKTLQDSNTGTGGGNGWIYIK